MKSKFRCRAASPRRESGSLYTVCRRCASEGSSGMFVAGVLLNSPWQFWVSEADRVLFVMIPWRSCVMSLRACARGLRIHANLAQYRCGQVCTATVSPRNTPVATARIQKHESKLTTSLVSLL
jgi:hypothetical protein